MLHKSNSHIWHFKMTVATRRSILNFSYLRQSRAPVAFIFSQRSAFWVYTFTQNEFRKLKILNFAMQLYVLGLLPCSLA